MTLLRNQLQPHVSFPFATFLDSVCLDKRIRSDLSFKEGFMAINVLKSKNDQLCKGDGVIFSQLSSPECPVELFKRFLAMFKIPPDSKDLIFKPISRGKGCCKLSSPDKPISYSTI